MSHRSDAQRHAKNVLYTALRHGDIIRPDACEKCGKIQTHRGLDAHHHNGYDEDHLLDVEWLCQSCHNKIHGGPKHKGMIHSEETKARMSATLKEHYASGRLARPDMRGENNPFYGKTHTPETRAKLSEAASNRGPVWGINVSS